MHAVEQKIRIVCFLRKRIIHAYNYLCIYIHYNSLAKKENVFNVLVTLCTVRMDLLADTPVILRFSRGHCAFSPIFLKVPPDIYESSTGQLGPR